jgi:hypothetical protein
VFHRLFLKLFNEAVSTKEDTGESNDIVTTADVCVCRNTSLQLFISYYSSGYQRSYCTAQCAESFVRMEQILSHTGIQNVPRKTGLTH